MLFFISPNEHELLKRLDAEAVSASVEQDGADIVFFSPSGRVGLQRKTIPDLVASLRDGRLQEELILLRGFDYPILILEGQLVYSSLDLLLLGRRETGITKQGMRNLLRSIRESGIDVEPTQDVEDTCTRLHELVCHFSKAEHHSLLRRPKPQRGRWGTPARRERLIWAFQAIDGVGPELAERLSEHWQSFYELCQASREELLEMDKIGRKKAEKIYDFLRGRFD